MSRPYFNNIVSSVNSIRVMRMGFSSQVCNVCVYYSSSDRKQPLLKRVQAFLFAVTVRSKIYPFIR